jgi:hypothetical protein
MMDEMRANICTEATAAFIRSLNRPFELDRTLTDKFDPETCEPIYLVHDPNTVALRAVCTREEVEKHNTAFRALHPNDPIFRIRPVDGGQLGSYMDKHVPIQEIEIQVGQNVLIQAHLEDEGLTKSMVCTVRNVRVGFVSTLRKSDKPTRKRARPSSSAAADPSVVPSRTNLSVSDATISAAVNDAPLAAIATLCKNKTIDCDADTVCVTVDHHGTLHHLRAHRFAVMSGKLELGFRLQIPLVPAEAVTIHALQGMTIPDDQYLDVDLSRAFAPGHVVVALTRTSSHKTLRVRGFNHKHPALIDPATMKFMDLVTTGKYGSNGTNDPSIFRQLYPHSIGMSAKHTREAIANGSKVLTEDEKEAAEKKAQTRQARQRMFAMRKMLGVKK